MKVVNIHRNLTPTELITLLDQKLDPLFEARRQTKIHFNNQITGGAVEIYLAELYEGFLFRIEIMGEELHITRSEHYVDDVNSLTVESILNEIFEDLARDGKVTLVLEG